MGPLRSATKLMLLEIVTASGFDVRRFHWAPPSVTTDTLVYASTDRPTHSPYRIEFEYDEDDEDFTVTMTPARKVMSASSPNVMLSDLETYLKSWLKYLSAELADRESLQAIEKWIAMVKGVKEPYGVKAEPVDFTDAESSELKKKLDAALERLAEIETTNQVMVEQLQFITEKLRELHEAVGRIKKNGWVDMWKGAFAGAGVGTIINKENATALFNLITS